ncbi:hypothetical protein CSCA_3624 [Clostridium scatologenes]|uniref:Uncharacterized protein n=1 Tax=Clostridium scatologenes TaxID=1548 RepID=A0A0E3K2U6_CLOSL|nr:hypothetical protein CSCA_3624 [Clostridium scatologenes]
MIMYNELYKIKVKFLALIHVWFFFVFVEKNVNFDKYNIYDKVIV